MEIYLLVNDTNLVKGWSEDIVKVDDLDTIKISIEPNDPFFNDWNIYSLVAGQLISDNSLKLVQAKEEKLNALRLLCQKTIEYGFDYSYNQVIYHFSLDSEAQFNFNSAYQLMNNDLIAEIVWTVTVDGAYSRLIVTKEMMNTISLLILQHKTYNIGRLRDVLAIQVDNATTIEELELIQW